MVTPALSLGVLSRLADAEAREVNPHFQDDYRIAWITVLRAARGEPGAHVSASYTVLGLHPDKVWPAIVARRKAQLGARYEEFFDVSLPPKKPAQSVCTAEGSNRQTARDHESRAA